MVVRSFVDYRQVHIFRFPFCDWTRFWWFWDYNILFRVVATLRAQNGAGVLAGFVSVFSCRCARICKLVSSFWLIVGLVCLPKCVVDVSWRCCQASILGFTCCLIQFVLFQWLFPRICCIIFSAHSLRCGNPGLQVGVRTRVPREVCLVATEYYFTVLFVHLCLVQ